MSAATVALRTLRTQCLDTAGRFHDYNFRNYFVRHTTDKFDAQEGKPDAEVSKFLETDGKATLDQLQRMAAVDNLYNHTPVILEQQQQQGDAKQ